MLGDHRIDTKAERVPILPGPCRTKRAQGLSLGVPDPAKEVPGSSGYFGRNEAAVPSASSRRRVQGESTMAALDLAVHGAAGGVEGRPEMSQDPHPSYEAQSSLSPCNLIPF